MNWRRLLATVQIYVTLWCAAAGGAGAWAFLISGICRIALSLGDTESIVLIGFPVFVFIFVFLLKKLPDPMRRAGMLSDDPERFGPWFR
ncbi:hypothetical protein [Pandoraea sputorum]|uniref:hypothetical protein n=1 Tax=Pandoraea sputorum TaxID=93222 RepID=UPI002AF6B2A5|nr:hypothetical protein [Pandoraea sputorum]